MLPYCAEGDTKDKGLKPIDREAFAYNSSFSPKFGR